jgi:hypothetical protein
MTYPEHRNVFQRKVVIEHYDPTDPADVALREYWEAKIAAEAPKVTICHDQLKPKNVGWAFRTMSRQLPSDTKRSRARLKP